MSSPVLWYATRATGLMALVLLTGTVVLGVLTTTRFSTARWPGIAQQDIHRRISMLAVVFVAGHILTSVLDSFVHIGWAAIVVPFASDYKRFWVGVGTISLDLMLAVFVTSLLRHRIPAHLWRGIHWLAYVSWPIAVIHAIGIGTDMRLAWVLGLVAACVLLVVGAVGFRVSETIGERRRVLALPSVASRPSGVSLKHRPHLGGTVRPESHVRRLSDRRVSDPS